ncbi:hypothetical protein [Plantibacter sp. M259]|uniref:hypothetical protein n=1 Tax=Plantibacter sp. M259 TaxID=2583822 RepID=UPI001110D2B2|nr:hypothetical protein [Plantibacter sp. M259]
MRDLTDLIVTAKLEKGHRDRKDATYDAMLEALVEARRRLAVREAPTLPAYFAPLPAPMRIEDMFGSASQL